MNTPQGKLKKIPFMFLAASLLMLLSLSACKLMGPKRTPVDYGPGRMSMVEGEKLEYGNFTVKTEDPQNIELSESYINLSVYYKDQLIDVSRLGVAEGEINSSDVVAFSPLDPKQDFPKQDCQTTRLEFFTGGANCCFGYYLMTTCPESDYVAYIPPSDASMDCGETVAAMPGTAKGFAVNDPYFMYYGMEGKNEKETISLSRVESPRLERFIIFDKEDWRTDKPGEFAKVYAELAKTAKADKEANPVANAIKTAYYQIMAGQKAANVKAEFKKAMPKAHAKLADKVFTDIQDAVKSFDPAINFSLPQ